MTERGRGAVILGGGLLTAGALYLLARRGAEAVSPTFRNIAFEVYSSRIGWASPGLSLSITEGDMFGARVVFQHKGPTDRIRLTLNLLMFPGLVTVRSDWVELPATDSYQPVSITTDMTEFHWLGYVVGAGFDVEAELHLESEGLAQTVNTRVSYPKSFYTISEVTGSEYEFVPGSDWYYWGNIAGQFRWSKPPDIALGADDYFAGKLNFRYKGAGELVYLYFVLNTVDIPGTPAELYSFSGWEGLTQWHDWREYSIQTQPARFKNPEAATGWYLSGKLVLRNEALDDLLTVECENIYVTV